MTADEFFDGIHERVIRGDASRPADLSFEALRASVIRRLADPDRRGTSLAYPWVEFSKFEPHREAARLESLVRETALPRRVRARYAALLASADVSHWNRLREAFGAPDDMLSFEGHAELVLTLQHAGMRHDVADLLDAMAGFRDEAARAVERTRGHVGIAAAEAWAPVLTRADLRECWLVATDAIVTEGSPEGLALLDLALLDTKSSAGRALLESARQRLIATHPAVRRSPPRGETYCRLSKDGLLWGVLAIGDGGTRAHSRFTVTPGGPVSVHGLTTLPTEASAAISRTLTADGTDVVVEAPLGEVLSLLARTVKESRLVTEGPPGTEGAFRALLARAPAYTPIPRGTPLSDAEVRGAFRPGGWFEGWEVSRKELARQAQALIHAFEGKEGKSPAPGALLALSDVFEFAAWFLQWQGRREDARRLASHLIREATSPEEVEPFGRLAAMWIATHAARFESRES